MERLLDWSLMKKDIAHYLLTVQLDSLSMNDEDKSTLRAAVSSVGAYRVALGMPHFNCLTGAFVDGHDFGDPPSGPTTLWNMCFQLVEAGRHFNWVVVWESLRHCVSR